LKKKTIILVNTGSPDRPDPASVRRYLKEFLGDARVISLPWLARKALVNMIIAPFRAPVSAAKYRQIWTSGGSPLTINHTLLAEKLQARAGSDCLVLAAMRYGNPGLREALQKAAEWGSGSVTIIPLYPQYASSTTGSVYEHTMRITEKWESIPELIFRGQFYSHDSYIEAMAASVMEYDLTEYDHVLFSYHGLPVSQVNMIHPGIGCDSCNCDTDFPGHGAMCYRAVSYRTTRLLAARLNLDTGRYSTAFQSRFGSAWLSPFTETVLDDLVRRGLKRVLVVAPSFTADCLETLYEIGVEYREMFLAHGGERLDLVQSLNHSPLWVEALASIAGL
jgi:ferrochelatase